MIKTAGSFHPSSRLVSTQKTNKDWSELRRNLAMSLVYIAGFSLFIVLAMLDRAVN